MQILVNADKHVDAEADLIQRLEEEIARGLARFADQVTRVEDHAAPSGRHPSGRDRTVQRLERPIDKRAVAEEIAVVQADRAEDLYDGSALLIL
jgi:hypothetical protein